MSLCEDEMKMYLFNFIFILFWKVLNNTVFHFMCTVASCCSCVLNHVCEMNMSHQAMHLFEMQHQNNFGWAAFTQADCFWTFLQKQTVKWWTLGSCRTDASWHLPFNIQFIMYLKIYIYWFQNMLNFLNVLSLRLQASFTAYKSYNSSEKLEWIVSIYFNRWCNTCHANWFSF